MTAANGELRRLCAWCERRPVPRRDARYCSPSCKQMAYENRERTGRRLARLEALIRHAAEELEELRSAIEKRQGRPQRVGRGPQNPQ